MGVLCFCACICMCRAMIDILKCSRKSFCKTEIELLYLAQEVLGIFTCGEEAFCPLKWLNSLAVCNGGTAYQASCGWGHTAVSLPAWAGSPLLPTAPKPHCSAFFAVQLMIVSKSTKGNRDGSFSINFCDGFSGPYELDIEISIYFLPPNCVPLFCRVILLNG